MRIFYSTIFLLFSLTQFAQQSQIDSLVELLKTQKGEDEVELLNEIAYQYRTIDPDQTKLYAIEALSKAEALGNDVLVGKSFQNLGCAYFYAGDIKKALNYDLKALENFENAGSKKDIAKAMVNIAIDYDGLELEGDAERAYNDAIDFSIRIEFPDNVAKIKRLLAAHYSDQGEYTKSIENYEYALDYRIENGPPEDIIDIQNDIALVFSDLGDYQQALNYFQLALDASLKMNYVEGKAKLYNNIGNLYLDWKQFDEALEYYRKAEELNIELSDEAGIAIAYNNMGEIYQKKLLFDSAEYFYNKSLDYKRITGDSVLIINTLANIAVLEMKRGGYDEALKHLSLSLKVYEKNNMPASQAEVMKNIAQIYWKQKDFRQAISYLNKSTNLANKSGILDLVKESYYLYFEIYQELNDYKNALKFHKKYLEIKDTLFDQVSNNQVVAFKTKYQTQNKENEIKLLKKDQALQKSKQRSARYFYFGFGLILILIAILIYSRNRTIQNTNKNLEKKNLEILQQKELLDEKSILLDNTIKQLEETNKELEKLSIVARETDNAILIANAKGYIEWVNQGFVRMYGYDLQEFIDYKGETLIEAASDFEIKNKIRYAISSKKTIVYDTLHLTKHGDVLWVQTVLTPIVNDYGDIIRIIAIETDITKIKKAEEEAKSARLAEESNRAKSEFLANMSHEIRTPLNAIIGFAKLLANENLSDKGKEFVDTIQGNGNVLLTLINDILDLSKIESERFKIKKEPVEIKSVLIDIMKVFSIKAKEKELDFNLTIQEGIPELLMLDEKRIRQVMINLIGNAIKFTDSGFVEVKLEFNREVLKSKTVDLLFSVDDSGIGIDKDTQEAIFEAFKQQISSSVRKYSGTGLGLTISKRFVEAMGGNITFKSEKKKGSLFVVEISDVVVVDSTFAISDEDFVNVEDENKNGKQIKDFSIYRNTVQNDVKEFSIATEDELEEFNEYFNPINNDCEAIKKSPKIKQIKKFATSLIKVGKHYNLKGLILLGEDLFEEADRFKINNMKKLLSYYNELFEIIRLKVEL